MNNDDLTKGESTQTCDIRCKLINLIALCFFGYAVGFYIGVYTYVIPALHASATSKNDNRLSAIINSEDPRGFALDEEIEKLEKRLTRLKQFKQGDI